MSMQIDDNKPLTEEGREYLESRGMYSRIERIDALHNTDDSGAGDGATSGSVTESDVKPYTEWTTDELRNEIDVRNEERSTKDQELLSKSGKKADLVAALEQDDSENAG